MKHITEAVFNDTVVAIINLVEHFQIPLTKTTIRERFLEDPNYPNLRLNDIFFALSSWNLNPSVYKADEETLRQAELPVLTHLSGCQQFSGVFVVLTKVEAEQVTYTRLDTPITEPIADFIKKWSGFIIAIDPAATGCEEDYDLLRNREEANKAAYRQSMKLIDGFLSPEDCRFIIEHCTANDLFKRSQVTVNETGESTVSDVRTSSSAVIKKESLPFFEALIERITQEVDVTGCRVESLQCVRYAGTQSYELHFDGDRELPRRHTVLIYLNDDFEGGTTWFSEIDTHIHPKTGKALFFKNIDENRDPLLYSAHAGMPVTKGVKYALNIWIQAL